jgi:uracil-DNA glycosylase
MMNVNIETHWKKILKNEFKQSYFQNLVTFIKDEYTNYKCFPKGKDIFKAFELSPFPMGFNINIHHYPYFYQN